MILYSSHVLEVVEKVCSQVLILCKGRVAAHDSIENLRDPMHESSLEGIFARTDRGTRPPGGSAPHSGGDAGVKWLGDTQACSSNWSAIFCGGCSMGNGCAPGQWHVGGDRRVLAAAAVRAPAGQGRHAGSDWLRQISLARRRACRSAARGGTVADELSLVTLVFCMTGLVALLEWQSLFPSGRDYLAMAGKPILSRQIFTARFRGADVSPRRSLRR